MFLFLILILLGALCLLIGAIVYIVGGFRESVAWGLILLLGPIVGGLAGYFLGLLQTNWWWMVDVALQLPWVVFLFMCWEKAKSGFLLSVTGMIFYAAAFFSIPPEAKPTMEAFLVAQTGQPLPPALAGFLGSKPGAAGAKGATQGKVDPNAPPTRPGAVAADSTPGTGTVPSITVVPANLDTEAQVLAAVAELNDRARTLMARKEALKNSTDQPAVFALAEDIKAFNERLRLVTARQAEFNKAKAPPPTPTPTPRPAAPVIPPTVVIPLSTPPPAPATEPKRK